VRGNSAIEVKGHWSDAFLDREMTLMPRPKKEWGGDSNGVASIMAAALVARARVVAQPYPPFDAPSCRRTNRSMFVFGEIAPKPVRPASRAARRA